MDNPGHVVSDFEEEVLKKKNKRAAKKKEWLAKLRALVGSPLSPHLESSFFSSPRSMSALVLALMPAPMPGFVPASVPAPIPTPVPAPLSCLGSFVVLSSSCIPTLAAVSHQTLMLPLPMLGLPLFLRSSLLRTFKQFLSDKRWLPMSTSSAKLFCRFSTLDALNLEDNNSSYNPTNKNKRKRGFDTTFINSCPLTGNYDQKEVDLSFAGCKCPAAVKLNRSWQLDLFDPKPVCIIEDILLAAALFWDLFFASCICHTMKLALKLGLRTNKRKNGMVKKRIEAVLANKTVSLLDRLFKDNPVCWTVIAIVYAQPATRS